MKPERELKVNLFLAILTFSDAPFTSLPIQLGWVSSYLSRIGKKKPCLACHTACFLLRTLVTVVLDICKI